MNTDSVIISTLIDSIFLLATFGVAISIVFIKGRQTLTNIIIGCYIALVLFNYIPFQEIIDTPIYSLIVFCVLVIAGTWLMRRLMPSEYSEGMFEDSLKKVALAVVATTLIMALSYHALPVTELITPSQITNQVFGSVDWFFYWLIGPLVILYWAS